VAAALATQRTPLTVHPLRHLMVAKTGPDIMAKCLAIKMVRSAPDCRSWGRLGKAATPNMTDPGSGEGK
jgi:hypothetical protein